jgi:hypothetical protein
MTAINLDKHFISEARVYSKAQSRSVPKQIEHWAKIGRIAEDNPDLTYAQIRSILLGMEDVKAGRITEFHYGEVQQNSGNENLSVK